ncbi:MAG: restriction endonuclease subunit S [Ferruginibacter sp.]
MKLNYKPIGKYIREIDIRNEGLKVKQLLGLSISKQFIPSVANIIGTDMENYKIIRKNQFACSTMQVRRDKKMPVALLQEVDEAIISQAYPIFEVVDEKLLLPEYLMMWFTRTEFDREACFHAIGGVRGSLEWEDFLALQLPIPSITKQKEIVAEYNTIQNRITLNKQLIQKLEDTAQAIYKNWFVDFEFPDKNGKPYKSKGGEMVESVLGEIPKGWQVGTLGKFIESASKQHDFKKEELIFFNTSDILNGEFLHSKYSPVVDMPGQAKKRIQKYDILYSEIRPANKRFALVRKNAEDYVVSTKLMVLRLISSKLTVLRFYHYLTLDSFIEIIHLSAEGRSGTFPQITFEEDLVNKQFIIANDKIESKWQDFLDAYYKELFCRKDENKILEELKSLLLSKLATIEN